MATRACPIASDQHPLQVKPREPYDSRRSRAGCIIPIMTRIFAGLVLLCAALHAQSGSLNIYWVDVEGGAATLIVTPAGESLLVDTGNPTPDNRDAKRIYQATQQAGLKKID